MKWLQFLNEVFDIGFSVTEVIADDVSDMAVATVPPKYKPYYDAGLAEPHDVLIKGGSGFHVGEWSIPFVEAHSQMVLGCSGSNKTTSCIFPMLLNNDACSYVIYDPSSEIFNGCAAAMHRNGTKISIFDPDHPCESVSFNGLAKCTDESQIYSFVNVLVRNDLGKMPYDYWAQSAEGIIVFWSKLLWKFADARYVNLANVNYILKVFSYDPERCDALVCKLSQNNEEILTEYRGIVSTPEKTLQSSLATARTMLRRYDLPNVCAVTSGDTVNYSDFRKQKHSLFIKSTAAKARTYGGVMASLIEYFINEALNSEPGIKQLPLTIVAEEAANLMLPNLNSALSLGRKSALYTATLFQDFSQVESVYGKYDAANIFANSTLRVFMGGNKPLETCQMLEKLIGKRSIVNDAGNTIVKEVLPVHELRELTKAVVLCGNKRPCIVPHAPFFTQPKLKRLAGLPRYQPEQHLLYHQTPLIPLI
jgi:type IV secretory pathway TraG/TraD family ATPase VirD4